MNTLYIMVGLPGSGKSTWAKWQGDCEVVSTDEIREEYLGSASCQAHGKFVFDKAYEYINDALVCHNVVFDATNVTRRTRKQIMNKCPCFNYVAVYMNTDIETCKQNNKNRKHIVPEEVINRMSQKLQIPTEDEGFSKVITVRKEFINVISNKL